MHCNSWEQGTDHWHQVTNSIPGKLHLHLLRIQIWEWGKNPKSLQLSLWNLQWKMTSANRDNPGDSNTPLEEAGDWSPKLHALCAQGQQPGSSVAMPCLPNTGNPKHRMCHYCELLNCHIPSSDLSKAFTITKTRKGQSSHQKTPQQQ